MCRNFEDLSCRHSDCPGELCPIESCRSGKKRRIHSSYFGHNNIGEGVENGRSEVGSRQQSDRRMSSGNSYFCDDMLHSLIQMESGGLSDDSPIAKQIGDMAEKIVKKLDEENPLLPEGFQSMPSSPVSVGLQDRPHSILVPGVEMNHYPLSSLYPIVERPEDMSPMSYNHPTSLFTHMFHNQPGSMGPISSELDGVVTENGMPSRNHSLGGAEDMTIYPHQKLMFDFSKVSE